MSKETEQMLELIYNILLDVKPLIDDALFYCDFTELELSDVESGLKEASKNISEAIKILEEN